MIAVLYVNKYFGELGQMDASIHEWWPGMNTQLHATIDVINKDKTPFTFSIKTT